MSHLELYPLHVGLSVADLEASIAWYRDIFGFELVSQNYVAPLKCKIAFIKKGNFEIELFQHDQTIPLPEERRHPDVDIQTQGTKHICFFSNDVPALLEELKKKGVDIVMGPKRMGEDFVGYIRDNNGILIEFVQKPQP